MEGSIGSMRVIQLSSTYSASVNYSGTATVSFTLPSGVTYLGAGVHSFTCSIGSGGASGVFDIVCVGSALTLTVTISGNWGSTTITGKVILNVFVM